MSACVVSRGRHAEQERLGAEPPFAGVSAGIHGYLAGRKAARSMWRWGRAWRGLWGVALKPPLPSPGLGLAGRRAAHASGSPRPVPLSYKLLDSADSRPALVFLHGLFGSKTNFQTIGRSLQQQTGRRVLIVDARNHGESPHSPDSSYEAMSADMEALLPQLGLAPCVLIGHSMGGKTAMTLALQKPELVERLISVDISPLPNTVVLDFPSYLEAMKAVQIPEELSLSQARKVADQQLSPVIQDSTIRQFLLTNLVESSTGQFEWRVNIEALIQQMDKILDFPQLQKSYPGPTLFLSGAKSTFIQPSHYSEIKRLFPQAQILSIPGAGHWIHADQPQDFMTNVKRFLA
ncbi:sn-1-specific diacylglycerol lipase ABHD11-like [Notamacropus eugenii]|uniref:sn-1-specific diacylglycerol lipase ABHD11-like n=1 Tax=Notamacropus eugenii TaxID=9315 RepID=UPI003B673450